MIKTNKLILKLISISIGFTGAFFVLEIFARILPATNIAGLEKPIICDDPNNVDLNCFHRRSKKISFRFTKGKLPPFEIDAIKNTNDIGQFSSIDFNEFVSYENNRQKIRILTIGDSQVEALQVDNSESFHDLFNNSEIKFVDSNQIKNNFISTSIGSSGMAFPNYIQYLKYVLKHTSLDSDFVLISIQSNDFDESFEKYAIKGRRSGRGQFFFDLFGNIKFKEFPEENFLEKLESISLKNSSLIRYLTYNVEALQKIKKLKIYCLLKSKTSSCHQKSQNYAANLIDESYDKNPQRFEIGYKATTIFLDYLEKLRNSELMKKNTILLVDADRGFISGLYSKKGSFFDSQRKFLIKHAKYKGFTVIDLERDFTENFSSGLTLNSNVDGHWNESGHKIVFEAVWEKIKNIISN